jgi:glycine cleavage system regulatory protein
MQVSLIITILGPDRPGLVGSLSETLDKFQGSWTESRMSHLAGKFAGILQVSIPHDQVDNLTLALNSLQDKTLKVLVEKSSNNDTEEPTKILCLSVLGQDRPGIIHDITRQLAKLNVNIEELESHIEEASMSGGSLFRTELKLGLPEEISSTAIQDSLEAMSDEFMIDINSSSCVK